MSKKNMSYRDYLATEIIKIYIASQVRKRRMSVLSRIKWWLNIDGWTADYDINAKNIAEKSYEFADLIIRESKKHD